MKTDKNAFACIQDIKNYCSDNDLQYLGFEQINDNYFRVIPNMNTTPKMIFKQNPETMDWLCYIPQTSHAYYYSTKKSAKTFSNKVNEGLITGKIYFDALGKLQIK